MIDCKCLYTCGAVSLVNAKCAWIGLVDGVCLEIGIVFVGNFLRQRWWLRHYERSCIRQHASFMQGRKCLVLHNEVLDICPSRRERTVLDNPRYCRPEDR